MARRKPSQVPQRRRWGTWSIDLHKPSGRWRVRPPASVDPLRRPAYFPDEDAARSWAADEMQRWAALPAQNLPNLTLGDWLGLWYETTAEAADWSRNTRAVYATHLWYWSRVHGVRLRDLKRGDLNAVVGKLRTVGAERRPPAPGARASTMSPRPLSAKVIRDAAATLKRALEAARDDGLLDRNPAARLELPKHVEQRRALWTLKERRLLLAELEREPLYPVFVLLFTAGLRIGEVLALQWRDVDWEQSALLVRRTVHKGQVQEWTKGRKSRVVTLARSAWAALLRHRDQGVLTGPTWVFTREDGGPIGYERIRKRLRAAAKRAGVAYLPTHTGRHAHITELIAAGIPLNDVMSRVGHSKLDTLARYTHGTDEARGRLLAAAEAVLGAEKAADPGRTGLESGLEGGETAV
jgi:integrase